MKRRGILALGLSLVLLTACSPEFETENEGKYAGQTLVIYNVADYISNGTDGSVDLIERFEEETGAKVKYYTYDTNETMYNQFKLQKEGTYDLVLASEYMIEKFVKEGLIEKMDNFAEFVPNYDQYCSSILRNQLKNMKVTNINGEEDNLDEYTVGYMWGTLGIICDPSVFSEEVYEEINEIGISWDILWDDTYADRISIKNSIREAFVVGLMHKYSKDSHFVEIMNSYIDNPETFGPVYQQLVQEVFDFKFDGSDASIKENLEKIQFTKEELISIKDNIFGFETDSGKNDIVEGSKIIMNLAYSGDAVYSIETASDDYDKTLEYYVPIDGSNKWYDGWMIPHGSNKELAYEFLNFISNPVNVSDNIDYIGYTPFITGDAVFTNISYWYGASEFDIDSTYYAYVEETIDSDEVDSSYVLYDPNGGINYTLYECIKDTEGGHLPTDEEYFESLEYDAESSYSEGDMISKDGLIYNCISDTYDDYEFDDCFEFNEGYSVTHVFGTLESGRRAIIYPFYGCENLLETQYPSENTLNRCAVMKDFGVFNDEVVIMWGQVKAYTDMKPVYTFLIIFAILVIGGSLYFIIKNRVSAHYKRSKK